ncbi:hypothetical protein [Pectobacterium carotovorum]|uniref:hypothetical protein n=1 Tax=Pectobacterium carotovorum TaxID=554 RepID=UPI003016A30D
MKVSLIDNRVYYFSIVTGIAIFFPQFQPLAGLALEWVLTIFLAFLSFFFLLIIKGNIKLPRAAIYIMLIMFLLLLISVFRSQNIIITNDLFELAKPFYFFIFFVFSYNINWDEGNIRKYFSFLMVFLFFAAVFGIVESLTPLFNELGNVIYKGDRGVLSYKAVFSFISPYTFGAVLILPFFYFLFSIFTSNTFILKNILMMSVFLLCIILTQSRTIFIGLFFTLFISFFLLLFTTWVEFRKKFLFYFSILSLFFLLLMPFFLHYSKEYVPYLYSGIESVFENIIDFKFDYFINSSPSIYLRYEQLMLTIAEQDEIPLIGVAIGKANIMPESFYAMYFYRTGLLGVFLHLGVIFFAIKCAIDISKYHYQHARNDLGCVFFALVVYFISLPFSYFSSAVNDQTRSGFLFYSLLGLVFYLKKNLNKR